MPEEKILPVSRPQKPLPPGSWDCHAHVFGPWDAYPLAVNAPYQPPLGPLSEYLAMLDGVGWDHGVVVHPSAYGWDNSATSDAIEANLKRLRGIAVVPPDISDAELERLHNAGIRGVRITQMNPDPSGVPGTLGMNDIQKFAQRFKDLGWHFQVWASQELIREYWDAMKGMDVPVIFDHMAHVNVDQGTQGKEFLWFLDALSDSNFHIKMGPGRISKAFPDFDEVRPFHDAYVSAVPDQLVFSSDWPFISLDLTKWDPGKMVDLFDKWTSDETVRQKVFVKNPSRFYGLG